MTATKEELTTVDTAKKLGLLPEEFEKRCAVRQLSGVSSMAVKNKILVVDDEEALRTVLSTELEGEGYQVNTAADGEEAIKILGSQQFHLILLDIKMPNVDGFEVLKYVKQHQPSTKVIMLTGFADLKNAIESKKLGAEDFVSKPYDLVDLLTTVERVLGTS